MGCFYFLREKTDFVNDFLVKLDVDAPTPLMHPDAAAVFNKLRGSVHSAAGFDFLGKCGDIFRDSTFVSNKDGVANRSWHKTGRAFDYDQTNTNLVIVSEPNGGRQFFRTYLKCWPDRGVQREVRDIRGYIVSARLIDFTRMAEDHGFKRIPAWSGWQDHYNRREFWHSQYNPTNLTWDAAMLQLQGKSRPHGERVLGLNDRGEDVRLIEAHLVTKGYLDAKYADTVFDAFTKAGVEKYQAANGLDVDGLVGPRTRAKLFA